MNLALSIAVLLTVSGPGQVAGDATADGIFHRYSRVASALAADQLAGVKEEAEQIADAAIQIAGGAKIAAGARELVASRDLAHARSAFSNLSDAVIAFVRATHRELTGSSIVYCPMADKYWIQQGHNIKNPYYGASMLTCGKFVK